MSCPALQGNDNGLHSDIVCKLLFRSGLLYCPSVALCCREQAATVKWPTANRDLD